MTVKLRDILPKVLPAGWSELMPMTIQQGGSEMNAFVTLNLVIGLKVIVSIDNIDGQEWHHVSVSRETRLPSWDDMHAVKNLFIGREKVAIQLLPKESDYVNFHNYVLHMWHRLDGPTTTGYWG